MKVNSSLVFHKSGIHTFFNHSSFLEYCKDGYDLRKFDSIYIDGILLVFLIRLVTNLKIKRLSFDNASIAPLVFNYYSNSTFVFIGGSKSESLKFHSNFLKKYPSINCFCFNGYNELDTAIDFLKSYTTSHVVLVVGMGAPIQEKFLLEIYKFNFSGVAYTCGGFITQSARDWDYYGFLGSYLGLRVFVRFFHEPTKILKRIFIDPIILIFVYRNQLNP
jgi:UDP-N-acetyl-D-mannosaminuronic acid transferase (WecB/TagA/CpsF family)